MYGHELAEDIAQDVILHYVLYERRNGKQSSQTVEQATIDSYRRMISSNRVKMPRPILIPFEEYHLGEPEWQQPPSYGDLRSLLELHLHKLTPRQHECLELILDGLTRSQIAKQMSVSQSAVSGLIKYAIRTLKKELTMPVCWK